MTAGRVGPVAALVAPFLLSMSYVASAESPGASPLHASRPSAVQQQIRQSKSLDAAAIALEHGSYRRLARAYLRGWGPSLDGGDLSVLEAAGWSGREGRGAELHRAIERDMREWNPVFSLAFLEELLDLGDIGTYAVMLDLPGPGVDAAIDRRFGERIVALQDAGNLRDPEVVARQQLVDESGRLWPAMRSVLEDNIVEVLARALLVDAASSRLDLVERTHRVLETVFEDGLYLDLGEQVRHGRGNPALPRAIAPAIDRVLLDPGLDSVLKRDVFGRLLELFAELRNAASRDALLIVFDDFDRYDEALGERQFVFDETLVHHTVGFIQASREEDPGAEQALEVLDQLTHWLVERVEVGYPDLQEPRIVDTLFLLHGRDPEILVSYIKRFFRDFHALNPAGYESVVLHLAGILIDYETFRQPPALVLAAQGEGEPLTPADKVLTLLAWYDSALVLLAPTLPEVDPSFVEEARRRTLQLVMRYLNRIIRHDRHSEDIDERLARALLGTFERLAYLADPRDIFREIVLPAMWASDRWANDPLLLEVQARFE